jgi:hypothetical protein
MSTGPADADCPEAVAGFVAVSVLGFEVVLRPECVEHGWIGLEIGPTFFREGRTTHSEHPDSSAGRQLRGASRARAHSVSTVLPRW